MAKLNGTALLVYNGTNAIGGTTDCTLNLNNSLIDVSTKDSSGWMEYIDGARDWSIDFSGLYDPTSTVGFEEIADLIINRTGTVTVKISTEVGGDTYWTGSALAENCSLSAPKEDATTFSGTFRGTGALSKATVST